MPDGDIFHGLSGLYQKPYRILCEGKLERNECAWMTMQPFLKDLKKKGDAAILIAKAMGELLARGIKDSDKNQSIDWADLSKKLDRLAQQANIPNRTKSLALEAGKIILNRLRNGEQFDTSTIPEVVIEGYMQKVYVSEFEARIPPISNDHAQVDNLTFTERREALRKDIFDQINKWAKKANVDEGVGNLRRNRRSQVKEIDLEEDLVI
ncbi:hypothetical protein SAMD00079811_19050 [Scytonema sp. HK-05]|uniref:hypothetical protein n=1 Tax=Scytonema sp. HK-05 TaxID=1137095 RepID=UPI000936964C|nr:hypothetical protein [Scytonema sp. HK-05]OKH54417.1 hypothetical protein NIES2130_28560 [Scytonema sp. HK-05]BAY44309.1 hypothetical protein SAMD00079811_19050 [Scytonema sp. HK-05]